MDSLLAALGLKQGSVFAGLAGALVSYRFFRELKWADRIMTGVLGVIVALYCGPALTSVLGITNEKIELGVTFLTGALGISFLSAVYTAMPEIVSGVKDWIVRKAP